MAGEGASVERFLVILRRRWRIVLIFATLGLVSATGISRLETPEYSASASLLFRNPAFDQSILGVSAFTPSLDPTREAATNFDLVSLPVVASRTARALHLSPSTVQSDISIAGVGQADVAQVTATDRSPARAAEIANAYVKQYVLFRQQSDRAEIAGAQRLVQNELAALTPAERAGPTGVPLSTRAGQLGVLAELQTGNAEVVQLASVPTSPSAPNTKRNAILGGVLGLLLGVGLALLVERLDWRIRDPEELADAYGVPLLGTIPMRHAFAEATVKPLPPADAEAFAAFRARIRYFNVDRDPRTLLLTSAIPEEGKTTLALNLALAEATSGNSQVLLLEADLRRPVLAERLGLDISPGLGEILTRGATLNTALRRVPIPLRIGGSRSMRSLNLITAGALPPNPEELLASRAMADLLSALAERFDPIIIDSPSMSAIPDSMALMQLVNGAIIVGRLGSITRDAARDLGEQLRKLRAPVLGVLANDLRRRTRYFDRYRHIHSTHPPKSGDGREPRSKDARPGWAPSPSRSELEPPKRKSVPSAVEPERPKSQPVPSAVEPERPKRKSVPSAVEPERPNGQPVPSALEPQRPKSKSERRKAVAPAASRRKPR